MRESANTFPTDWDTKTIGDIACHVGSGATPTGGSSVYSRTGIAFIRSQNVTFKGLLLDDVAFIGTSIHQQMARSEIFPHDVLLNITGASIGRCCFVPPNFGLANVNQHVCAIRLPRPSHEDAVFLAGVLASHIGQSQIDRLNAGGNREGLNYQQVRSFVVPWPRSEERKRIAAILEATDEAIAKTEAVIAKLKQVRAGLLHDLLTRGIDKHGQLRDPIAHPEQFQESLLGRIPGEWEIKSLNEIVASAVDGPFGSNLKTEHYVNEPGVRVVRLQNIEGGRFDESDEAFVSEDHALSLQRHQVVSGDLLVASMGDENHPLARACLYPAHLPPGIVKADCFRLRMKTTMAANGFVMLFLNCPSTRRELNVLGQGVTRDRVNLTTLLTLRVLQPPIEEQRHIVKMIEALDLRIQTEEVFHSKLAFLKSGLMTDLLTGRVRVPESIAAMEN